MLSPKHRFLTRLGIAALALAAIPSSTSAVTEDQTEIDKQLTLFLTVFQRVRSGYVDKVDDKALIKGAIDGMLASLDPHSSYMDGSEFDNFKIRIDGNYPGIGATVVLDDGFLKIVAPTEDSPAWTAGLKPGGLHHPYRRQDRLWQHARRGGRHAARRNPIPRSS